ncbi:hypothetical protein [Undibacterium umbellatum]|uniref:Uncharacterized protein n=1 Tax=Undibacterium umbellatum TaxID=2762300 RepID=A0ABR6ZHV1_9BURK|nr:hypothetical protein [Undibacterium umbellatum]MBC3911303.1 hypothetical protein [Undibacterium umbellatum]
MTLTQLLAAIRASYITVLFAATSNGNVHVEPAYRNADGTLSLEGKPALPCRADWIPVEGEFAGQSHTVDAKTQLEFEPFAFQLSASEVSITPFTWDWLPLQISGLSLDVAEATLTGWFMAWFDGEDGNAKNADGLYGVVHFMSGITQEGDALQLSIDLGSVSEAAVEDLLFKLADANAEAIQLG